MSERLSEIRESVDVLSKRLPGQAIHTLAEQGEPNAECLSLDDIHILLEKKAISIRRMVRHAVCLLLREHPLSAGSVFDDCHAAFQGTANPLLEVIRTTCRSFNQPN